MISARRRIELAIGPSLLWGICHAQLERPGHRARQLLEHCRAEFKATTDEAFLGLSEREIWSMEKRLWELRAHAVEDMANRPSVVFYATVIRWLEAVTAAGLLRVSPGRFTTAIDRLHSAIQESPDVCELLDEADRSARKAAKRMHVRMQGFRGLGYFPGPDPFKAEGAE